MLAMLIDNKFDEVLLTGYLISLTLTSKCYFTDRKIFNNFVE